jgi:hypothetical protein
MAVIVTSNATENIYVAVTTTTTADGQGSHIPDSTLKTALPLALRAEEISESDFELLLRIAENPDGIGRLRRPAGFIPTVKPVAE